MGGIEHSDRSAVELEDQAFDGVNADAVAGECLLVVLKFYAVAELA